MRDLNRQSMLMAVTAFDVRCTLRGKLGRLLLLIVGVCACGRCALAQGGPPYYTNDPGTPGPRNWEINLGYEPFLYVGNSITHTPDLDLNYGIGDRIQLTYENAWLRVKNVPQAAKFGLGQSNFGVKWRFLDGGEDGLSISTFPQGFVNNPNHSVRRGVTPQSDSFLLPVEFSKKFGPVDLNLEVGYNFVHNGSNGWLIGVVAGHRFNAKLEVDAEFYNQSSVDPYASQPTIDAGLRYRIHRPIVILLMSGRGLEPATSNQPYFVGYFGVQLLLPPRSYDAEQVPESKPTSPYPPH